MFQYNSACTLYIWCLGTYKLHVCDVIFNVIPSSHFARVDCLLQVYYYTTRLDAPRTKHFAIVSQLYVHMWNVVYYKHHLYITRYLVRSPPPQPTPCELASHPDGNSRRASNNERERPHTLMTSSARFFCIIESRRRDYGFKHTQIILHYTC